MLRLVLFVGSQQFGVNMEPAAAQQILRDYRQWLISRSDNPSTKELVLSGEDGHGPMWVLGASQISLAYLTPAVESISEKIGAAHLRAMERNEKEMRRGEEWRGEEG